MKQNRFFPVSAVVQAQEHASPKKKENARIQTEHPGSGRIWSLEKENTYAKTYPQMSGIRLLNLNYVSMPEDETARMEYILRVIERDLKKTLLALQEKDRSWESALTYMKSILGTYHEEVAVQVKEGSSSAKAHVASAVLETPKVIRMDIRGMGGQPVFGAVGAKKRKEGYYFLRSDASCEAHVVDLPGFLAKIVLLNGLLEVKGNVKLPLVQNIFEEYEREAESLTSGGSTILAVSLKRGEPIPFSSMILPYQNEQVERFCLSWSGSTLKDAARVFGRVLEIYQDIRQENRHRTTLGRSIATAYITKKNIPPAIRRAMSETDFMNYFKFVEFDEKVDPDSVNAIEKEFEHLNHAYFADVAFREVKLRFRKLGKHKASGLYYPTLHTLCVDIRTPSSFLHEYFHMIDDQLGDLSLGLDFNEIVSAYKEAFLSEMDGLSDSEKKTLHGSGKYNLGYFFRRAEIFARCGEIYFSRILGVESSLLVPELNYAYPASEKLDELVKKYYEHLLGKKLRQVHLPLAG